jgi:hypothetical protein
VQNIGGVQEPSYQYYIPYDQEAKLKQYPMMNGEHQFYPIKISKTMNSMKKRSS